MNKKYMPSAMILYLNYFIHGIGCSILGQAVIKEALAASWGVEAMAITAISAALGLGAAEETAEEVTEETEETESTEPETVEEIEEFEETIEAAPRPALHHRAVQSGDTCRTFPGYQPQDQIKRYARLPERREYPRITGLGTF